MVAYTGLYKVTETESGPITGLTYDISRIDPLDYAVYDNNLYLKSTIDSEYVYHDVSTYEYPRAVINIPNVISSGYDPDASVIHSMIKLGKKLFDQPLVTLPNGKKINVAQDRIAHAYNNVGAKGIATLYHDEMFMPNGASFGIQSNVDTYGPWVSLGPAGGIEVEQDNGLLPWEYGSYSGLNTAGNALARAGTTHMQVGEVGSISIAGTPKLPIGTELNSLSALGGQRLIETRVATNGNYAGTFAGGTPFDLDYSFINYGFLQNGTYGPSITNISVEVGSEISTSYQFKTYTPAFGTFARVNAERLKEVNQNRMQYVRDLQTYVRNRSSKENKQVLDKKRALGDSIQKLHNIEADRIQKPNTPHELFVGQLLQWGDSTRTIMTTTSFNELPNEFSPETYEEKSIASLDSILRPVSIKGAGGLPRLIKPLGAEPTGLDDGSPYPISQVDLNPYFNPTGLDPSGLLSRRYTESGLDGNLGHDIDLVSRTNFLVTGHPESGFYSGLPETGLLMHGTSGYYDYKDDYRTLALRGPLLLQS